MAVLDIGIGAKVAEFEEGLKKLKGITEKGAKAAVAAYRKELEKGEQETNKVVSKYAKAFNQIKTAIGPAINGIGSLSAGILAAGAGFKQLADEQSKMVRSITDMSARTQLSADTLNGLRLAANSTGKEMDDMLPEDLAVRIMEAAEGAGTGADAFKKLGIQATDSSGNLRSGELVFRDLIDSLAEMEDRTHAAALADDLFSDAGTRMLATFKNGSADLDKFISLGKDFGYNVGPEGVKQAENWQSATSALSLAFEDAKSDITNMTVAGKDSSEWVKNFALGFVYLKELAVGSLMNVGDQVERTKALMFGFITIDEFVQQSAEATKKVWSDASEEAFKFFKGTTDAAEEFVGPTLEMVGRTGETTGRIVKPLQQATQSWEEMMNATLGVKTSLTNLDKVMPAEKIYEWAASTVQLNEASRILNLELAAINANVDKFNDTSGIDALITKWEDWTAQVTEVGRLTPQLANSMSGEKTVQDTFSQIMKSEPFKIFQESAQVAFETMGMLFSELESRQGAAIDQIQGKIDSLQEKRAAQVAELRKKHSEATKEQLEQQKELTDKALMNARREKAERVKVAKAIWNGERAMNISQALMAGGVAVMNTFAQFGWPAGIVPAAFMTAQTGVQVGLIASQKPPTFAHTGYTPKNDEMNMTILRSESVNSPRATANNADMIKQMNQTGSAAPVNMTIDVYIGQEKIERIIKRNLNMNTGKTNPNIRA